MADAPTGWTLGQIAQIVGGDLRGPADLPIQNLASAETPSEHGIGYAESQEFLEKAIRNGLAAIIVPAQLETDRPSIVVQSPRMAFAKLLAIADRPMPLNTGVHPAAIISDTAVVDPSASIGPYAVVEAHAVIGAGVRIYPFCYVGDSCKIGPQSVLYPGVTLYKDVTVGERCILHSGLVLGADGFGFVWDGSRRVKVPQAGRVELGDEVELGANTTVDRATMGATRIGSGTKLDNQVQIAHNVTIGQHSVFAAMVGIAGSSSVGDRCVFGGQSSLSDHVTIGNDITFGGRTGTSQDITEPGAYFGAPALPAGEGLRVYTSISKLPSILKRLRALEQEVERLKNR